MRNSKKDTIRLYIDLDGTLAKWMTGTSEEELLEEGYYRSLPPELFLVNEVNQLLEYSVNCKNPKLEIYILSHYLTESRFAYREKIEWVKEHLPKMRLENILLIPCGHSKAEFVADRNGTFSLTEKDFLLDDYNKNLNAWKAMGGTGIKCCNGINDIRKTWNGLRVSTYTDPDCNYRNTLFGVIANAIAQFYGYDILEMRDSQRWGAFITVLDRNSLSPHIVWIFGDPFKEKAFLFVQNGVTSLAVSVTDIIRGIKQVIKEAVL